MKDVIKRILCVGCLLIICCMWIGGFYFVAPTTVQQKDNLIAYDVTTNVIVEEAEGVDNVVQEPTVAAPSNEELAEEVIAGKWGSGEARKEALIAAGYDYEAIQKIVNEKTTVTIANNENKTNSNNNNNNTTTNNNINSAGKIVVPSTGTSATIKTATFEPYNVQNIIDQGYAAYYSDYASTATKKIYGGHNYSAFAGLSNVTIGAAVYVDGVKYTVREKTTGGPNDWSPLLKNYSSNMTIILQTCSGKGYNNYIICY